jgi:plastocyanin
MTGRRTVTAVVAAALALATGGCSTSSGAADHNTSASGSSQEASHTKKIAVTVHGNDITPNAEAVTVSVGETVELEVTADRAGELHVHSSPQHEFEFKPGKSRFRFHLNQPGAVEVEEHVSDALVLKILVQ